MKCQHLPGGTGGRGERTFPKKGWRRIHSQLSQGSVCPQLGALE